jgi:hypothetical protein
MSIYTNSSTNLAHGIETRDLLFTLSNGMNIYSVSDGAGRLKFWFSTSNDLEKPEFDIRHYMEDAQEWYYTNYVQSDSKSYENTWHNRVKECLELAFVPLVSSVEVDGGFILYHSTIIEQSPPAVESPLDSWYLVENWKLVCEYCQIDSNNVCVLPTGQIWVSGIAMRAARNINLSGLKRNQSIWRINANNSED